MRDSSKIGNFMSLFSRSKSVATVLECNTIYNSIFKSNILTLIFTVLKLLKLSG